MDTKKAIFWDRDGVINEPIIRNNILGSPRTLEEFILMDDIYSVLNFAREQKFMNIIVTNQPDVARGKLSQNIAETIKNYCLNKLPIDEYIACYHDDDDNCMCRKPKPGMVISSIKKYGLIRSNCIIVGDRSKDIKCGEAAGLKTVLYNHGLTKLGPIKSDFRINLLSQIKSIIMELP